MRPEPTTRKTGSPFFTGRSPDDTVTDFAGEASAGVAVFDFAGAGMARLWAVALSLSIAFRATVDLCTTVPPLAGNLAKFKRDCGSRVSISALLWRRHRLRPQRLTTLRVDW